jgi:hypothetical protein
LKLSCVAPTPWSYAHNYDSDSETLPPGPWWGEALLEEDGEFFPLPDYFPEGQGKKEVDAICLYGMPLSLNPSNPSC